MFGSLSLFLKVFGSGGMVQDVCNCMLYAVPPYNDW